MENVDKLDKEVLEIANSEAQLLTPKQLEPIIDIFDIKSAEEQSKKLLVLFEENEKRRLEVTVSDSNDDSEQKVA